MGVTPAEQPEALVALLAGPLPGILAVMPYLMAGPVAVVIIKTGGTLIGAVAAGPAAALTPLRTAAPRYAAVPAAAAAAKLREVMREELAARGGPMWLAAAGPVVQAAGLVRLVRIAPTVPVTAAAAAVAMPVALLLAWAVPVGFRAAGAAVAAQVARPQAVLAGLAIRAR